LTDYIIHGKIGDMSTVISDEQARNNIAANLQRIIEERGITQTQLAAQSDQPIMTINRLVRGQNEPRIALVARVAEALDVSVDRLVAAPPILRIPRLKISHQENLANRH
jgi:transcriptional regulator with XRE-family HTH domain